MNEETNPQANDVTPVAGRAGRGLDSVLPHLRKQQQQQPPPEHPAQTRPVPDVGARD